MAAVRGIIIFESIFPNSQTMDVTYYFKVLGLIPPSSMEEVRRAYRKRARQYHPDLNKSAGATEKFIEATEAYEYLTNYFNLLKRKSESVDEIREKWIRYRQEEARDRARRYASNRYNHFKKTGYYRSSAPAGIANIVYNLIISFIIIFGSIFGYITRLDMVDEGYDPPTLGGFFSLLFIGVIFLSISLMYLVAYYQIKKARRKLRDEKN